MDEGLLYAIAQIAVAVAGFSAIAVVLRRSAPGGLSPHARRTNAVLGLAHLVLLSPAVVWFARNFPQVQAEWQPIVSPLQSSLIAWSFLIGVVQILAALGIGMAASPGLYTPKQLAG